MGEGGVDHRRGTILTHLSVPIWCPEVRCNYILPKLSTVNHSKTTHGHIMSCLNENAPNTGQERNNRNEWSWLQFPAPTLYASSDNINPRLLGGFIRNSRVPNNKEYLRSDLNNTIFRNPGCGFRHQQVTYSRALWLVSPAYYSQKISSLAGLVSAIMQSD